MFATKVRVRPCSDLLTRSSSGRVTCSSPFSPRATLIGSATRCSSAPFGPRTLTSWPSTVTSTPDGIGTGSLPMRDTSLTSSFRDSPHVREDFAAHAVVVCLPVGKQTLRRRDNGNAEPAQHLGQAGRLGVDAKARFGDPAHPRDGTFPVLAVLQGDRKCLADMALGRLLHRVAGDVALVGQDLRDLHLDLAVRHSGGLVIRLVGISYPGQHVRNRICHGHGLVYYFLGAVSLRTCSVEATCSGGARSFGAPSFETDAGFDVFASWDDEPPRLVLRCGAAHGRAWPSA